MGYRGRAGLRRCLLPLNLTLLLPLSLRAESGEQEQGTLLFSVSPASFGEAGSLVTLICDGGGRCLDTCFDDRWLDQHGYDIAPYLATLEEAFGSGRWP